MSSSSLLRKVGVAGTAGTLASGSVAALLAALAATAAPAAAATTFIVDDATDTNAVGTASDCTTPVPGSCSLRDAAAAAVDGDTITFAAGISSITLENGGISLYAVNVTGPGSGALTISTTAAAGSYSLFSFNYQGADADVTVSGLTVTKNRIFTSNSGDFTLDDVVIEDSADPGTGYGGALYAGNQGDLFVRNSHFEGNNASYNAGAIYVYNGGDATISDSTFTLNSSTNNGGAIYVDDGVADFTLERSTVSGNESGYGGGLKLYNAGDVTITDSVLDNNLGLYGAGGAYFGNAGTATITRTSVTNNSGVKGGGLYFYTSVSSVSIVSSLIADNSASQGGGGIFVSTSVDTTIANSTLTGNSSRGDAGGAGGALYFQGNATLDLLQVTITDNTATAGGGLYVNNPSTVVLAGAIIAGNTALGVPALGVPDDIAVNDEGSTFNSSNSIIGTVNTRTDLVDDGGTIRTDDPGLEALADNGGPTKTMALSATSVALDAGPATVATFPDNQYDQRGIGYARVVNGIIDIGAFEVQAPEPVVPSFTG